MEGAIDQSTVNSSQIMQTPQPKKMVAKSMKQSPFTYTSDTHHKQLETIQKRFPMVRLEHSAFYSYYQASNP